VVDRHTLVNFDRSALPSISRARNLRAGFFASTGQCVSGEAGLCRILDANFRAITYAHVVQ
jgi:hypothetical protein